ncbi:MAG TPA: hypothetical protein VLU47_04160 [Blastocatellia bacterium]|nr:hypothetical protein [Blastocatellia bacterium]
MRKLLLIMALSTLALPALAQSRNCLRLMTIDELVRNAILIARVKVHKVSKAKYKGEFSQLAILRPVDVIEGDFTLDEFNVLARASVRCAEDNYNKDDEMLVFLEPEESLFHTVNFQYGQFAIVGDIVKGWRDKTNKPVDKPYSEVRQEIVTYVSAAHSPPVEPAPSKPPVKPPEQP